MFEDFADRYRVVKTTHASGDTETTIPLGSWRKGGGLEGSRGHVYHYGNGWAGIWTKGPNPRGKMDALRVMFANLVPMQVGAGEGTFRVPMGDLPRLLPILKAKRLRTMTEGAKNALVKARKASPLACARANNAKNVPGSTQP